VKVRFQADNDLDYRIVRAVRQLDRGIDFQSALQAELHSKKDPSVLRIAAEHERILVSHDRKTMPQHFADFIQAVSSPGLIIVSTKLSIADSAEWLHLVWSASESEEYVNSIFTIP
jgi:precorrin-6B methylase 1